MLLPAHKLEELDFYSHSDSENSSQIFSVFTFYWKRHWLAFWKQRSTVIKIRFKLSGTNNWTEHSSATALKEQLDSWSEKSVAEFEEQKKIKQRENAIQHLLNKTTSKVKNPISIL